MTAALAFVLMPALAFGAADRAPARKGGSARAALELRSPAFKAGGSIPRRHTCQGQDVSPALAWSGAPAGTQSFALVLDDPDAPAGVWVHWVLYDLPAGSTGLPEGLAREESLPDGSKHGSSWGVSVFDRVGYYGPCPPPGKPHRYVFRLYALDKVLGLASKAAPADLREAMRGHILEQAELSGFYRR